jgi:hypothetical protein
VPVHAITPLVVLCDARNSVVPAPKLMTDESATDGDVGAGVLPVPSIDTMSMP